MSSPDSMFKSKGRKTHSLLLNNTGSENQEFYSKMLSEYVDLNKQKKKKVLNPKQRPLKTYTLKEGDAYNNLIKKSFPFEAVADKKSSDKNNSDVPFKRLPQSIDINNSPKKISPGSKLRSIVKFGIDRVESQDKASRKESVLVNNKDRRQSMSNSFRKEKRSLKLIDDNEENQVSGSSNQIIKPIPIGPVIAGNTQVVTMKKTSNMKLPDKKPKKTKSFCFFCIPICK